VILSQGEGLEAESVEEISVPENTSKDYNLTVQIEGNSCNVCDLHLEISGNNLAFDKNGNQTTKWLKLPSQSTVQKHTFYGIKEGEVPLVQLVRKGNVVKQFPAKVEREDCDDCPPTVQQEKDRGNIWDWPGLEDYKKGLIAAKSGDFKNALIHFEKQVQKTKADQRLENEKYFSYYGLFPKREIGVIHFQEKSFKNAIKYLEESVTDYNSAKGRFYLEQARRNHIEIQKLDDSFPVMDVETDIKDIDGITKEFWVQIKGRVEDDSFVSQITINQKEIPIELSSGKLIFEKKLPLHKGQNVVLLRAEDINSKVTEKKINIYNDSDAPLVSFAKTKFTRFSNYTQVTLSGEVTDAIEVSEFSLEGKTVQLEKRITAVPRPERLAFNKDFYVFGDSREFDFVAKDRLENLTKGRFTIRISASGQARLLSPSQEMRMAVPIKDWLDFLLCSFLKLDSVLAAARSSAKAGPKIYITNLEDEQKVYLDKIFIEGNARDSQGIRSLSILGAPQPIAVGVHVFFGTWLPLDVGKNRIIIRAENQDGTASEKVLNIIREEKVFRKIENRMVISILPFVIRRKSTHHSDIFMELLKTYFVSQGRFRVVERDQLSHILQEQKLVLSDLVEKKNAIRVGKLLSADAILMGAIHESANFFEVVSWLVDVETSEIMESKEEYTKKISVETIREIAQSMVYKYHQAFPFVEGTVLSRDEQLVYEDIGTQLGIKTGRKFIVFRDQGSILEPKFGIILGRKFKLLGEVRVIEVFKESSRSKIIRETESDLIGTNDCMIAK
jgi:tetratricopeptide (TPR) repeat protein